MKSLSKNQFWALVFFIKILPLVCMLVVWHGDLWTYRKNIFIYVGAIIFETIVYALLMLPSFAAKKPIENRNDELFYSVRLALIGFFCMYSVYSIDENDILRFILTIAAISLMYQGNRQSLIRQDAPNAGLMHEYSERTYKKSQRISGRILFGIGAFGLLLFLITPSQHVPIAVGIFFSVLFIGAFVFLYKSGKAVDE